MAKTILLIHGRGFKPAKADLRDLLIEALHHGVGRDHPSKLPALRAVRTELAYYGDLSNEFLSRHEGREPPDDLADRQEALRKLKEWGNADFTRENYRELPGASSSRAKRLTSATARPLAFLRVSEPLIRWLCPDVGEYWNSDSKFGSDVRWALTEPLAAALERGDDLLLLSHSLGTLVAFDTLWKLSYYGEYRAIHSRKVGLWLTLGSPLGDPTYRRNLKGARTRRLRRYPTNVVRWVNVAARDDYIAYKCSMARDYRRMQQAGLVDAITDHLIYNLSLRGRTANVHHLAGHLVHPVVAQAVADWL